MVIVAGVDIGNESTEVALARVEDSSEVDFLASALVHTTGIKGTPQNIRGIVAGLKEAAANACLDVKAIDLVRLNEAAPVIGDVAMETITETIVTESTMIGHDPGTPAGVGIGVGSGVPITDLASKTVEYLNKDVIAVVTGVVGFEKAAAIINQAVEAGVRVRGAIVQKDDAVLICNRLKQVIPIVDEVREIEKIPLFMPAAVEVARQGSSIVQLCNPYGIATIFSLTSDETAQIVPVAKALIGNRSAVVIRTPSGGVETRVIPAGILVLMGDRFDKEIGLDQGAKAIMDALEKTRPLKDVAGKRGTNVGGMLERVRSTMSNLTGESLENIRIEDILAVDTTVPQKVKGAVADQFYMENAVALAAMVKTSKLPMQEIARLLADEMGVTVEIGGIEAQMAMLGALTTPGVTVPLSVLDVGAGSTDAAYKQNKNLGLKIPARHLAGAGSMVTMLIDSELGLDSTELAEDVKVFPAAKVETLYTIRLEDGSVKFLTEPAPGYLFGRVVVMTNEGLRVISGVKSIDEVKLVRQEAKKRVFGMNAVRALEQVTPTGSVRDLKFVVLVGGSALDFEIPQMVTRKLSEYGVVSGAANVRGCLGPRNAVATGLVLSYTIEKFGLKEWSEVKWRNA